jgi:hypothetical protein
MLREKNRIGGIGAKTARNILWLSLRAVRTDRFLTYVTSATQKKNTTTAKRKDLTSNLTVLHPKK